MRRDGEHPRKEAQLGEGPLESLRTCRTLGVAAHTLNVSTQEAEGDLRESEASLASQTDTGRPCLEYEHHRTGTLDCR